MRGNFIFDSKQMNSYYLSDWKADQIPICVFEFEFGWKLIIIQKSNNITTN